MKFFRRRQAAQQQPPQPEPRVNRFKETPVDPEVAEAPATEAAPKKPRSNPWADNIRDLLSGEFLSREGALAQAPYLLFISMLLVTYVSIGYYYEHLERERQTTERRLEELRSEYKTLQAEFETQLQQSQVEQSMADLGLVQPVEAPYLIQVAPRESDAQ